MLEVKDYSEMEYQGVKYKIKLLNTTRAFITGEQIIKLVSPSLGSVFDGMTKDDLFEEKQTMAMAAIHLITQMGNVEVIAIVKELLADATADDKAINFDTYFRGHLNHLRELLEFSIKENYGSVFQDMNLKQKLSSFMTGFQIHPMNQQLPVQETLQQQEK